MKTKNKKTKNGTQKKGNAEERLVTRINTPKERHGRGTGGWGGREALLWKRRNLQAGITPELENTPDDFFFSLEENKESILHSFAGKSTPQQRKIWVGQVGMVGYAWFEYV